MLLLYFIQTGAIIEDGQTGRDRQPTTEAAANTSLDVEKLEVTDGNVDTSCAEEDAESSGKIIDTEDKPLVIESSIDKPRETAQDTKPEPIEEIEVDVEEFYVKYKNL